MRRFFFLPFVVVMLSGCGTMQVSDEDVLRGIDLATENAARYGIKYAVDRFPEKAEAIFKDVQIASTVIKTNIIPVFSGISTAEVLRSAVDTALNQLSEKLSPTVVSALQLAVNVIATRVKLPANPADKLDERTKTMLLTFFASLSRGLDAAIADAVTIISAAKTVKPALLTWPTK